MAVLNGRTKQEEAALPYANARLVQCSTSLMQQAVVPVLTRAVWVGGMMMLIEEGGLFCWRGTGVAGTA